MFGQYFEYMSLILCDKKFSNIKQTNRIGEFIANLYEMRNV